MAVLRYADIQSILKRYIKYINGSPYLPAENVIKAQKAIASRYDNLLAYVEESKTGFKYFKVDRAASKSLVKVYLY